MACEDISERCCHESLIFSTPIINLPSVIGRVVQSGTNKSSPIQKIPAQICGIHNPEGLSLAKQTGKLTQEGEWPHICIMYENTKNESFLGGATLIAPGVLVTAAHELE